MSDFNRTINVYVESGEAQKSYDILAAKQDDLKEKTQQYIDKGKDIPDKLTKQLEAVTAALDRQSKKLSGELSPSYKDLTSTVSKLTQEVSRMSAQDAGFATQTKELEEAKTAANAYRNSVINVGAAMQEGKEHGAGFSGALKEIAAGFTLGRIIEEAARKIKEFFQESIKEALALELGQKQLKNALEGVGRVDAMEKLNKQAEAYSKKFSYLYVPEITKVQESLVTFGRLSMNQINDVLPVIINFAAKTGQSMEESTSTILSAMEGNGRALKKFGLEIVKDGTFAQNYGLVMNQLAARVDGAAATFDNTSAGALARFGTAMKERQEQLGNELLPILAETVDGITGVVDALAAAPKFIMENKNAIFLLIGAYVMYNAANIAAAILNWRSTASTVANTVATTYNSIVKRASAAATMLQASATNIAQFATAVYTGEISLATAATMAWGAATAMATGGLTLIIAAVAAGASAWAYYATRTTDAMRATQMINDVQAEAAKNTAGEKANLEQLLSIAKDETITKEKRMGAIKQINAMSPEYLGNITLEKINTEDATKAVDAYVKSLNRKALTEAASQKSTELHKQLIEEENKAGKESLSWMDKAVITIGSKIDGTNTDNEMTKIGTQAKRENIQAIQGQIDKLDEWTKAQLKAGNIEIEKEKPHKDDNKALRQDQVDKKLNHELEAWKKFYQKLEELHSASLHVSESDDEKEMYALAAKYKEQLQQLSEFYKKKVISRQEYNAAQKLMNETYVNESKQLEAEHDYTRELKALEAMYDKMREMNGQRLRDGEISEKQYNARIIAMDSSQLESKMAIADKYAGSLDKAKQDQVKFTSEWDKQETQAFLDEIAKRKAAAEAIANYQKDAAKNRAAIEGKGMKDETEAKIEELNAWYVQEAASWQGNEEVLTAITADYQARRNKIIQDGMDQTLQAVGNDIKKYGDDAMKVVSSVVKIMDQMEDRQLKKEKAANATQLKGYKDMLDNKRISTASYNKMVEAANAEMAKKEDDLKRKQFERNKAIKIAEAVINTAAAVLQALANNPPPLSYAMAAIAGVLGGVEIGVIAAEKYADGTPSFGGPLPGQSHSEGGNPIIDGKTGQKIGEVERGEAIIPGDAVKNNPEMINHLLTTGRKSNLINTLRPVQQLDQAKNLGNIAAANHPVPYHAAAPKEAGNENKGGSDDEVHQTLKGIHSTLKEANEYHKTNAEKPVLSVEHIQEAERKQQFKQSLKF